VCAARGFRKLGMIHLVDADVAATRTAGSMQAYWLRCTSGCESGWARRGRGSFRWKTVERGWGWRVGVQGTR
jgi:hypothetical protein